MSDDQNIDAGSETSGETAAPAQAETTDTASETAQAGAATASAGDAAEQKESSETSGEVVPDANESRTGYADKGLKAGDPCTCPDGRTGTVHRFDAGLICLPNQG